MDIGARWFDQLKHLKTPKPYLYCSKHLYSKIGSLLGLNYLNNLFFLDHTSHCLFLYVIPHPTPQ